MKLKIFKYRPYSKFNFGFRKTFETFKDYIEEIGWTIDRETPYKDKKGRTYYILLCYKK